MKFSVVGGLAALLCGAVTLGSAAAAPAAAPVARVQHAAPGFSAQAVVEGTIRDIKLSQYKGRYLVLFFYPLDFTFVCPTEIIAFSEAAEAFRKVNAEIAAVSVDSVHSHLAWTKTRREDGGVGGLKIPLISDINKSIARDYGVLIDGEGIALRGLFIIDPSQTVRHITINDLPIGRSVDEAMRVVQAIQYAAAHDGEACPANWQPGSKAIFADPEKSKKYFSEEYKTEV
eukprot:TRINITY_DN279_c3_g1_i1.p1 TRINITY_DN279_c3_g1~~TRINITY_DN279_c3_g1_i1.p1  ORF type:complete len:230 (-),score=94.51 TRINITY_DN279_c3_g1_i1:42-731(-)